MQKFDANGKFLTKWTKRIMRPTAVNYRGAVAVDSSGNSYYAFESRIEKYNAQGDLISATMVKRSSKGQAWEGLGHVRRQGGLCLRHRSCGPVQPSLQCQRFNQEI